MITSDGIRKKRDTTDLEEHPAAAGQMSMRAAPDPIRHEPTEPNHASFLDQWREQREQRRAKKNSSAAARPPGPEKPSAYETPDVQDREEPPLYHEPDTFEEALDITKEAPPEDPVPSKSKGAVMAWLKRGGDTEEESVVGDGKGYSRLMRQGLIAGGVVLAAILILVSTVWARLTVVVKLRVQEITLQDIALTLDASAVHPDIAEKIIPAEKLSFSKKISEEFHATGKNQVLERARGTVVITNRFSSIPQKLIASTRLVTDQGIVFRLPKAVTIPGAKIVGGAIAPQSIEAEVLADAAGEESNSSGEQILRIPGFKGSPRYDGFTASSARGFSGGFRGEAVVASADDIKKAEEAVTKKVFDLINTDLAQGIPPGFSSPPQLREVEMIKVDKPASGSRHDTFTVTAEARARALAFRETDALALADSFALRDTRDQEVVAGSTHLEYHPRSVDLDKGKAETAISGRVKIKAIVHTNELASSLVGKKQGSLVEFLQGRQEISNFKLLFFPPWRASAPSNPLHIRFTNE